MDTLRSTRGSWRARLQEEELTRRRARGRGGTNQKHNVQGVSSRMASGQYAENIEKRKRVTNEFWLALLAV